MEGRSLHGAQQWALAPEAATRLQMLEYNVAANFSRSDPLRPYVTWPTTFAARESGGHGTSNDFRVSYVA